MTRYVGAGRFVEDDPAPLDPSKVKAGDTVTIEVENGDRPKFTIIGEVYSVAGVLRVGGYNLHGQYNTLTDHQPAPEPEPEWVVGEVYDIETVQGEEVRAVYTEAGDFSASDTRTYETGDVETVRPLVVIDPAAVDWRGLQAQMSVLVVGAEPFKRAGDILAVVRRELGIEVPS